MKVIRTLILGVVSLIFTGGPTFAQAPIKIGASISLTGTYAKLGSYTQDGYLMCAKEVNDKGACSGGSWNLSSTTTALIPRQPSSFMKN